MNQKGMYLVKGMQAAYLFYYGFVIMKKQLSGVQKNIKEENE